MQPFRLLAQQVEQQKEGSYDSAPDFGSDLIEMYMFPGSPFAIFTGLYAALASAVANLVTRRRWTAALVTGLLVSLLPQLEARLEQQPLYYRLMRLVPIDEPRLQAPASS